MLKHRVLTEVVQALETIQPAFEGLNALASEEYTAALEQGVRVEHPRNPDHGDFAVNISFLARWAKTAPPKLAEAVCQHLNADWYEASAVAGFVNLTLSPLAYCEGVIATLNPETLPGANTSLAGEHVHLEYVSANPTGPLHVGHGRWAALGDSIRRVLEHNGATVTAEFYVNDFGQQMRNLANSIWFRCLEELKLGSFPEPVEGEKFPYYPGDYCKLLAQQYLEEPIRQGAIKTAVEDYGPERLPDDAPILNDLRLFGRDAMLEEQKALLEKLGVRFDVWTLESSLHDRNLVDTTLERLKGLGKTYMQDGALWLKSSEAGDEKDRVLIKTDGSYTYLTADVAYHDLKYQGPYTQVVNIWGADHHGYIPRMRAAIEALGHNVDAFEVMLGQLVNLVVDGENVRMGKRTRMLTLEDVVNQTGVDAIRFWLVSRSPDSTIDFDVNVAASASEENPVFYAQYAHARASSILRTACQPNPTADGVQPARVEETELSTYLSQLTPQQLQQDLWEPLAHDAPAQEAVKALLKLLDTFDERVETAGQLKAPHLIAKFALDAASQFHSFYAHCRVITEDKAATKARLALVKAYQLTLKQALGLLGVSAPEQM